MPYCVVSDVGHSAKSLSTIFITRAEDAQDFHNLAYKLHELPSESLKYGTFDFILRRSVITSGDRKTERLYDSALDRIEGKNDIFIWVTPHSKRKKILKKI